MSILEEMNPVQQEAVKHVDGPLLILAGAGSGKTRVLTHRVAWLISECGVNPWNILAITFTNKAAGEMRERVDRIVDFGAEDVWVSTFHSMCVRILRRYIDRLGYERSFTIYDTDDQKTVIKEVCRQLEIDTKIYKERSLLAAISSAKEELLSPEAYEKQAAGNYQQNRVASVYRAYQARMKSNNALDFDDLLVKTVELFEQHPDVLEYYQERFKYIMVDEYQDTNTVQFRLVSLLAARYRNICVVGDDDQSIYKFRGANIHNILDFEKTYPEAKVIRLEQNYRSTQNILAAANGVIRNNTERKAKTLWTENEEGDKVRLEQCQSEQEEALSVARDIARNISAGKGQYKDYAVLYRTNAQSRVLEEKLIMLNIPYRVIGGVNFYQRKEIKDILGYLKTIGNGRDDVAVARIINVPKRGIGAASIAKADDYAQNLGINLYESLRMADGIPGLNKAAAARISAFVNLIEVFRAKADYLSLSDLFDNILEETGYLAELTAEHTDEAQTRIENLDELRNKIVSYEKSESEPTLSGLLEQIALVAEVDSLDDSDNKVLLMTLHSAKGLEFPNVYICGMEDGLFPGYLSITSDDPSDLEEERRLCYVGFTRAMKTLKLSAAASRMQHGNIQRAKLSRFVREIPEELLDTAAPAAARPSIGASRINRPSMKTNAGRFNVSYFVPKGNQIVSGELEYGVGDTVRHVKFGTGKVLDIKKGGKDYEVTVQFERFGVKKMFAGFAKLKKA